MSSTRRTRTTRSMLTTVAIGAVAAVGLVISAPGSGAFAVTDPHSPEARVGHSIETGHLLDDMESGRITESDIVRAASVGIDVGGRHIDNWIDLSAAQAAEIQPTVDRLDAAAKADPEMMAARDSLAKRDGLPEAGGAASAGHASTGGSIAESKHWWSHLIHWVTLYINHNWLRGLIGVSAGAASVAVCVFFDLSRVTCGILGAFFSGGLAEVVKGSASCNGKGVYIKLPDTWNSHCEE
ncbi:hypothetical protein [Clavibacter nebraskensis]|uniref:Secreted protein n=2 Tax=Clavibacter nebraskensis TaxID=31963 RepID=A0A399Q4Z0_9MICO|nr:hypothetical protein [Clavibacter nebraskensis]KXU21457.1 hypothetical protein VV38_03275 [Clavibacter nebraskensis]OAH19212.1 hypothetical protein A3Q38_09035 [Clavibacter nebraskensis]QGV65999.1 hypothetical protein EGX36_03610 [Clavibacter nebraskensis]QGV68796.1 hypothetical protein EGX37_03595 [Clavibacter nebraskensis]QGV71586.1 hypothetical protein EGX35_03595 [Clavibacter nebraskensis]